MRVASIGLGLMGSSLARRMAAAGHSVTGFDKSAAQMAAVPAGVAAAGSISEAVAGVEAIVLSLPNSEIGKQVCLGPDGVASAAPAGAIVIDATTARPADTLEMAAGLAKADIHFMDATVSGNPPMADRGELVVMAGGDPEDLAIVTPLLEAFGRAVYHVGPVGAAARTKLIVNHALGIHRVAVAEVLVVAEKAGLDLERTLEVLKDSAASSKAMDIWGERMIAGAHFPPLGRLILTRKDLRLIVEQADEVEASAELVAAALAVVDEAVAAGLGDADNGVVMEAVRRRAGLTRFDESAILDGREETSS
jgi:3-hydroxyisobutyrate dehydrogenase-like beta-hydroxyacid dehydrogenase